MTNAKFDPREWHQINGYLDRALDLEPPDREACLQELAKTQPELIGVVRQLLVEHEILNAEQFLEHSPVAAAAIDALQHASMAGKQIGAYTIDRLLGRGGMGEVWLASRSDGRFEGQCAIKLLSTAVVQSKLAERFRYEAGLLARLGHPNVARLLDAGETTDGGQFLVLEYVDGVHIDEYCTRNALTVRARVRLFLDAVAAVAHAHSQLIVHRDLKPSNVLVTRDGTVKLLDFGVAKLLSPDHAPGDGPVTRVEEIAITPEYAAPEQLLGETTSTATDVYQLGMLLYVLLSGRHPLQSPGNRAERIKAALNAKLPRASDLAAGVARKQLRGDLDAILGKALHPSPQERYQTAAALRDDLVRHLNRDPVSARRDTGLYGLTRFIARHRVATAASLLTILSLCGMLVFAVTQARVAARERDHAVDLASRNAAVTEFLGTLITEAAESDKPVTVTEMLARSEKLALADTSDNPENRAAVLSMIGDRYMALGEFAAAERLFGKGHSLLADSNAEGLRAKLDCQHASSLANLGQTDVAVRTLEREIGRLQGDPATAADCMLYRSSIAANTHDVEPALRYAKEALERLHAAPHVNAVDEGVILGAIGWGYHLNGQNREADEYYRRALQKYADVGREGNADAITLLNDWALVVEGAGAPKRALEMYDRSLSLVSAHEQGATPPAQIVGNRGNALQQIGRLEDARAAYETELRTGEQQHNLYSQMHALSGLASVSLRLHESAAAAQYVERMTAKFTPGIPAGSAPWRQRTMLLGRLDLELGRFDAAREKFTSALGNPGTPLGINAQRYKSEAELRGGDAAAAVTDARQALENSRAMQGGLPYSYYTGLAWLTLGRAEQQLGQSADARLAFENAALHLSNTVDDDNPYLLEARNGIAPGGAAHH